MRMLQQKRGPKPGRQSLGPREQYTIRIPDSVDVLLQRAACEANYRELNDYVVALITAVFKNDAIPDAVTACFTRTMAAQKSDGKPGRPSLGTRKQRTIRFPVSVNAAVTRAAAEAGYRRIPEYVVDLVAAAIKAGVTPPTAQDTLPGILPLSA